MTTENERKPDLIERLAREIERSHLLVSDGQYRLAATAILPIVASAIDEAVEAERAGKWQDIATAPRDGTDILTWFDHKADTYQDPQEPNKLTDYAAWAEGGDFMDGEGVCIAKWFPKHFEAEDEYGTGYWMPEAWFAKENGDYERVCNPTHWQPLPEAPQQDTRNDDA